MELGELNQPLSTRWNDWGFAYDKETNQERIEQPYLDSIYQDRLGFPSHECLLQPRYLVLPLFYDCNIVAGQFYCFLILLLLPNVQNYPNKRRNDTCCVRIKVPLGATFPVQWSVARMQLHKTSGGAQ